MNKKQKTINGEQIGVTEPDVARITALFQKCRESLERYLQFRLRGSRDEAEELAQEAYMRLITRRKRREVTNWESLLFCTARNLATNRQQQHRIRQAALMQIELEDHRTPETSWTEEQTNAEVQRAIGKLSKRSQNVIARLRKGQSYEQIAQQLGVNERTCRRDVELAVLEIRRKIGLGRHT